MSDQPTSEQPTSVRRLTPLERQRERLLQAEADIAQNARERVWLWRIFVTLPVLGVIAWLVFALVLGRNMTGLLAFAGAVGLAVVTYGTGIYMTTMRRREFDDAVRDARAEITRLERAAR
ncbi:MAG: hypothetical protein RL591_2263 [Planctomycetota bacterium]